MTNIKRNSELKILLDESNESLYWTGFILADGHINLNVMRLHVRLSIKDLSHLQKLASYLKTNVTTTINKCQLSCQDKDTIPLYTKK